MAEVTDVLEELIVVKRNGKKVPFDGAKIALAIKKGFDSVEVDTEEDEKERKYTSQDIQKVYQAVLKKIEKDAEEKNKKFKIEEKIVAMLKTVYDPEIPVNVYDLGLIYKIDVSDNGEVALDMTLTAPNCPAADFIMEDIRQKVESVEGVTSATINLVFEPEWDKDMMSEEAKLELGFL